MKAVDIMRSRDAWERAYEMANGKPAPRALWANGFFLIDGRKYRRAALDKMAARLRKVTGQQPESGK